MSVDVSQNMSCSAYLSQGCWSVICKWNYHAAHYRIQSVLVYQTVSHGLPESQSRCCRILINIRQNFAQDSNKISFDFAIKSQSKSTRFSAEIRMKYLIEIRIESQPRFEQNLSQSFDRISVNIKIGISVIRTDPGTESFATKF